MAYSTDKKPGELTALTSLATDDVFVVGDTSDASEVAKYITKANLITDLGSSFAPVLGADDNYVTDAEKAALHAAVTVTDSTEIDFTLTGQDITASLKAGSIDETKLDTSVNASLDLADSALQAAAIGTTVQAYDADLTTWAGITPGTGVGTALAVNVGSAGAVVTNGGALGTPSSGTVTNLTGTASININGTVGATTPAAGAFTTVSASSAITASTTVELGHATDTTLSRSSAGVIAVEGVVIPSISSTNTLTNKRIQPRTSSSTTASSLTPDLSVANVFYRTTQTATLTIEAPTGTPVIGETIAIYVDSAGAQTLTINSTFKPFGAAFPATTTAGKTFLLTAQYNGTDWNALWANKI